MKKAIFKIGLVAVSSMLLYSHAALAVESKESGLYLNGNLGYGKVNEDVTGSTESDNTGFASNINFGYKLNRNLALEAGFSKYPDESFGSGIEGSENYSVELDAKLILPIQQSGFELFGKLGAAAVHHKLEGPVTDAGTHTEPAAYVGAGASYSFTEKNAIVVQATATSENDPVPAMYLTTVGFMHTF